MSNNVHDDGVISNLYKNLIKMEEAQNIINIDEFVESYGILYDKSKDRYKDHAILSKVSGEFSRRFCLYRSILLTDDTGSVIAELPALYNEVKSSTTSDIGDLLTSLQNPSFLPRQLSERASILIKIYQEISHNKGESYSDYRRRMRQVYRQKVKAFEDVKKQYLDQPIQEVEVSTEIPRDDSTKKKPVSENEEFLNDFGGLFQ